jgi:hypothetical protein
MPILSEVNYLVNPANNAYPPCVGGGYVGVAPGTLDNPTPTTATLLASGPQYTVTPAEDMPLMLLFVGGRTFDLDATRLYKEAHDDVATPAEQANQLLIDIPEPNPGTPVNVNLWAEQAGGVYKVHVEPR